MRDFTLKRLLIGAFVLAIILTLAQAPMKRPLIETGFDNRKITASVSDITKQDSHTVQYVLCFIGVLGIGFVAVVTGKSIGA